jgi:putative flippase GtrA
MNKLALYIYVLAMPVVAGALVTGVLTVRDYNPMWLLYAAVAGAVAAVPVSFLVSREITRNQKT